MEIRHLKLLEAVAEEGNLSKVVDRLNVSSSALSHQLKEVEKELGLPLFHRVNKKLILTDAGDVLLKSARAILDELNQAKEKLDHLKNGQKGKIRISTECYTCYHWLPGVMQSFSKKYPHVDVSIHPEHTYDPFPKLLSGDIDAVITSLPNENSGIEYHELFRDEQLAIATKGHAWEQKEYVEPEDFTDENVIIYYGPVEGVSLFNKILIPNGITPRKVTELQLTEAQIEMVKAGYGVKVISNWALEPYLKTQPIIARPVTKKGYYRTWYLATIKQSNPPGYLKAFVESLKNHMKEIQTVN